jgi:uncharacterized protein (DUF1499 family)
MQRKSKRIVMTLLIAVVVLAAGLVGAVRLPVRQADTAAVDFRTFERRTSPNDALACPPGLCQAPADFVTMPVALSVDALGARVLDLPNREPRTAIVGRDDAARHYVLVQRSLVLGFPDTVDIAIAPVDAGHATVAVYSRSRYGRGDFGVNRARLKRWLTALGVEWRAAKG